MITVIIPARLASSRYPGKPLIDIQGLPMIEHVRRRALLAKNVEQVVVATCDQAIKDVVEAYGGNAVMTRDTHERCTDRVEEAMESISGDIVVMVQGDEPLLSPEAITLVAQPLFEDESLDVVNLLSVLKSKEDYKDQDIVKAVCNRKGDVMYLTRAPIPVFRHHVEVPIFRQTGIMAFRGGFLPHFSSLSEAALEKAESIDMLRALEHGIRIRGVVVPYVTLGVDRPADVTLIEEKLKGDPEQVKISQQICNMGKSI